MADAFIHEFHHNRLFFIEEKGQFLISSDADPLMDNIYYSPWRMDIRPLQGVLHATYVYIPVTEFWFNAAEEGKASEKHLAYARSQLLSGYLQLVIGLFQLNRFGSFTALGQKFFSELSKAVEEIGEKARRRPLSYDSPAIICQENGDLLPLTCKKTKRELNIAEGVLDHLEKSAPEEQKLDILKEQIFVDLRRFVPTR